MPQGKLSEEELDEFNERMEGSPVVICQGFSISLMNLPFGIALIVGMNTSDTTSMFFAHNPENISSWIEALAEAQKVFNERTGVRAN